MIYMFLANGFEEVEALAPLDLLRRAGCDVTTVGVGGGDTVVGAHGIAVGVDIPDTMFHDSKPEMVILPGGMPGTRHLDESRTVAAPERRLHRTASPCQRRSWGETPQKRTRYGYRKSQIRS